MEMASAQQTMTQTGAFDPLATVPLAISARVMTPMVFCASLVPCASETTQAEPTCPIRKPCLRAPSVSDLVIRYSSQVPQAATTSGDDRGEDRPQDDLGDEPVPEHGAAARRGDRGADDPADQRVRGAGRDTEQPGQRGSR